METLKFEQVTAIVLAGGRSTRMKGADKSMLPVRGVPMIMHIVKQLEPYFPEIIIGAADTNKYGFLGHRIVTDLKENCGPLMGIYSCLLASGTDLNFVTACDIPDINISFIRKMLDLAEGSDIIMPVSGNDHFEPLYAVYRRSVIPVAAELIEEDKLKLSQLFKKVKTRFISFDGSDWYHNINFLDDYRKYSEI